MLDRHESASMPSLPARVPQTTKPATRMIPKALCASGATHPAPTPGGAPAFLQSAPHRRKRRGEPGVPQGVAAFVLDPAAHERLPAEHAAHIFDHRARRPDGLLQLLESDAKARRPIPALAIAAQVDPIPIRDPIFRRIVWHNTPRIRPTQRPRACGMNGLTAASRCFPPPPAATQTCPSSSPC
jgi:hypothetical protein